jgi:hypothetical protein
MRFMCLLKADAASEAGLPPDPDLMVRMGNFMEEIVKEGVLIATDGLHPSAKGARVRSEGGKFTVIDGPFAETKELISSYAIVQVASRDEAVEWTKRFMSVLGEDTECEIRQIMEFDEFPTDVFPPEEVAKEAALREEMAANATR